MKRLVLLLPCLLFAGAARAVDYHTAVQVALTFADQLGRDVVTSEAYRALVIDSLMLLTAGVFFVYQLLKAAFKDENPWAVYINVCLTIAAVAFVALLYDRVSDAAYAFAKGMTGLVNALAFQGGTPDAAIAEAAAYVHTDTLGLNAMQDLLAWILIVLINGAIAVLGLCAWAMGVGAQFVFTAVKVVGFLTVPFLFWKATSSWFTGTVKGMAWALFLQPVVAIELAIAVTILEKFIELGGGSVPELTTANYGELIGILAVFGVSVIVLLMSGLITAFIVGGRDVSVDVSGFVSNAAGNALGAGGWVLDKINRGYAKTHSRK